MGEELRWDAMDRAKHRRTEEQQQAVSDDARDGSTTAPIKHHQRWQQQQQQQQPTHRQTTQRGPDATSVPEIRGMLLLQGPRRREEDLVQLFCGEVRNDDPWYWVPGRSELSLALSQV